MQQDGKIRNLVTDTLDEHRVHRQFLDKDVPEKLLERVLMSAIRSPSSLNGQGVTYLVARSQEQRDRLASVCGNNPHIASAPVFILFAMDLYRANEACVMHEKEMVTQDSVDALMVGSVDCGIALSNAIITAESLGLAVCPIGGVRINAGEISKIFNLPSHVFGVIGLVLGYPAGSLPKKPRFPYEILVHDETYQTEGIKEAIMAYDEEMTSYNALITHSPTRPALTWSQRISVMLTESCRPTLKKALKDQGLKYSK